MADATSGTSGMPRSFPSSTVPASPDTVASITAATW
jgi:hypothetical protein